MKPYQFSSMLKEISTGELTNGYYIFGDSQYLKERIIFSIREKLELGFEDFNVDEFWANELDDPRKIFDSILSIPMMSDKRMIIVNNIHKLPAKFKKELIDFKIPETSFLVLVTPSPSRGQTDYHKKFLKKFKSYNLPPPYDNEYGYWVMDFAKAAGKRISGAGIGILTKKVSPSLLSFRSELDKIYSYIGDRQEIKPEDIERVVSQSRTATIFQFVDAFGSRNISECLSYATELFSFGESATMMIFWLLKRSIELLKIIVLLEKKSSTQTMAKSLRVSPYWIKKYTAQAKQYSRRELVDFISILRQGDRLIKSGNMGQKEAVTYIIGKLDVI